MSVLTAPQRHRKSESEVRVAAVSFAKALRSGESLTGTPTVTEERTSDLTLDNAAVTTASMTINYESVAAGDAVTFRIQGGTASRTYRINIVVSTDSTPAQTLEREVLLDVTNS